MDVLDLITLGVILIVIILWIVLRVKCPKLFRKAKTPDKCGKCGSNDFLPVYTKTQKVVRERNTRCIIGGPVAFKCKNCGNEVKVKKGEGFLTSGDLGEPHA